MALETLETDALALLGNAWAMQPTAIGTRRVMSTVDHYQFIWLYE
jgi:hypothetical protein